MNKMALEEYMEVFQKTRAAMITFGVALKQAIDAIMPPLVKFFREYTKTCPKCRGKFCWPRCKFCDGRGWVWREEKFKRR